MTTPAARVSRTIDFPRAYFQPIMRPVHVDTARASAVAAKNIFMGSELGGGVAELGLALESQVSDHLACPTSLGRIGWSNLSGRKMKRPLLMQL